MILSTLARRFRTRSDFRRDVGKSAAYREWRVHWTHGAAADSGVSVNGQTALTYASVWQAVQVIAGDVGQLPLLVYRRTPDGTERAATHSAYRLLKRRPNNAMNASTFKETLQAHALLWGNGRAGILRDPAGRPLQLIPFLPDRSWEEVHDGQLYHYVRMSGQEAPTIYHTQDVIHIKGLGWDGITGYSVIQFARNSWGMGLAAQKLGNRTFANQAKPSLVLQTDHRLNETDAQTLLDDFNAYHAGPENSGRVALLHNGVKAVPLSMSMADAQWLETRRFQRTEVASWFNLPPHMLGDGERTSYASLEQENASYLNRCLLRWLNVWQEECTEKLLTEQEKRLDSHFAEFNTGALLRGDLLSRYRAYQIGISSEFLSPDEAREKENLNKRPDGQGGTYRNPNTRATDSEPIPADGMMHRRVVLVSRLTELLAVESKRLKTAAASSSNFVTWLEQFYGSHWPQTVARVLRGLGVDDAQAEAAGAWYCATTKNHLLDHAAGKAKNAQDLRRLVADAYTSPAQQAATLADYVLENLEKTP